MPTWGGRNTAVCVAQASVIFRSCPDDPAAGPDAAALGLAACEPAAALVGAADEAGAAAPPPQADSANSNVNRPSQDDRVRKRSTKVIDCMVRDFALAGPIPFASSDRSRYVAHRLENR